MTSEIKYTLKLFFFTRVVLITVGIFSRRLFYPEFGLWRDQWNYNNNPILNLWGIWDSGWYLDIAKNGYSPVLQSDFAKMACCGQSNLNFFPLYPILINLSQRIIGDYFLAGILISNLALILSSLFLYKLVRLDSDQMTALKSVKYLFLFPISFIFSAFYSESVFLLFLILTLYFASREKWLFSGVSGFLLSLTRHVGVLIIIPLVYEYFSKVNFDIRKIKPNFFYLLLLPVGLGSFMVYLYYLTGDPLAFLHVRQTGWSFYLSNPFEPILALLLSKDLLLILISIYAIATMAILFIFRRYIKFSYWSSAILLLGIVFLSGKRTFVGFPRFTSVVFPLFIIFAKLSKTVTRDSLVSGLFFSLQLFFMMLWSNGFMV